MSELSDFVARSLPQERDCSVGGHEWRLVGLCLAWCERCGAETNLIENPTEIMGEHWDPGTPLDEIEQGITTLEAWDALAGAIDGLGQELGRQIDRLLGPLVAILERSLNRLLSRRTRHEAELERVRTEGYPRITGYTARDLAGPDRKAKGCPEDDPSN